MAQNLAAKQAIAQGRAMPWHPKSVGKGFVYERIVKDNAGRVIDRYRGQSKNEVSFARRQDAHQRKMEQKYGKDVSVSFSVVGRYKQDAIAGGRRVGTLRVAEETAIRKGRLGGELSNKVAARSESKYFAEGGKRTFGGNLDNRR